MIPYTPNVSMVQTTPAPKLAQMAQETSAEMGKRRKRRRSRR